MVLGAASKYDITSSLALTNEDDLGIAGLSFFHSVWKEVIF